jgi:hypothetical protein
LNDGGELYRGVIEQFTRYSVRAENRMAVSGISISSIPRQLPIRACRYPALGVDLDAIDPTSSPFSTETIDLVRHTWIAVRWVEGREFRSGSVLAGAEALRALGFEVSVRRVRRRTPGLPSLRALRVVELMHVDRKGARRRARRTRPSELRRLWREQNEAAIVTVSAVGIAGYHPETSKVYLCDGPSLFRFAIAGVATVGR